jgi:hypothetical protein
MYESLILVDSRNDISIESLSQELIRFYGATKSPAPIVTVKGSSILLTWPNYKFQIYRSSLPHVVLESEEIANRFGKGRPDSRQIANCAVRFEVMGEDDPDMVHFNDYLYIGEAAERLGKVYRFDQSSTEFFD